MPCGRDPRGPPPRTCGFTCTTCGAGSAPSVSSGTLAATLSWSRRASWTPRPSVNAWSREAACSRQGTPTARPGHCASLGMWRGPAFGDLRNVDLLRAQAEHLEELRLDAVAQRIDADLILGEHHQVVNELARLAAEHPLRERFQAQLLLALYRSGRIAEALQAFDRYRRRLSADLGDPAAAVQRQQQLRLKPFAQRMLRRQARQLIDDLMVLAEDQVGVDALRHSIEPQLLQMLGLSPQQVHVSEITEGRASPHTQRGAVSGPRRGRPLPRACGFPAPRVD